MEQGSQTRKCGRGIEVKRPLQPQMNFPVGVFRNEWGYRTTVEISVQELSEVRSLLTSNSFPMIYGAHDATGGVRRLRGSRAEDEKKGIIPDFDPAYYTKGFRVSFPEAVRE